MASRKPKPITPEEEGLAYGKTTPPSVLNRRQWEASGQGQARMQELQPGRGVTRAQHYAVHGWGGASHVSEPTIGGNANQQLPGMEHTPEKAFTPPRWEDLSEHEQTRTLSKLAEHGGTDIHTMSKAFGAQMDQAYIRGEKHGTHQPFAEQFYSPGSEERDRMASSAKELGIPFEHHVVHNAITSPRSTFKQVTKSGDVSYPNDELAKSAVRQGQRGTSYGTEPRNVAKGRGQQSFPDVTSEGKGLNEPARRSVSVYHQLRGGTLMQPSASLGSVTRGMAEKTGPYANAWSGHPDQFLVSDRHTGQGGMMPHLAQDEAEKVMQKVPNFHSAADFAARKAMGERGYTHLRMGQAAQWGEEKIRKGENPVGKRSAGSINESQAYAEPKQPGKDQGQMFSRQFGKGQTIAGGGERPKMSATARGHTAHNEFTPGSQWDF